MTAIPEVLDALVSMWRSAHDLAGLRDDQIYDGPSVNYIGTEGVAVGASVDENSIEFSFPPSGLESTEERFTVACLVWSGSGDTAVKPRRDRVAEILGALELYLAQDRTLGGVVSEAWIVGGSMAQEQNRGALVTAEIQIQITIF